MPQQAQADEQSLGAVSTARRWAEYLVAILAWEHPVFVRGAATAERDASPDVSRGLGTRHRFSDLRCGVWIGADVPWQ